jgi:hypothetical protein
MPQVTAVDDQFGTHRLARATRLPGCERCRGCVRDREARTLDEDTLTRERRVLGDDHPNTLGSASNLARDLYPHRLQPLTRLGHPHHTRPTPMQINPDDLLTALVGFTHRGLVKSLA